MSGNILPLPHISRAQIYIGKVTLRSLAANRGHNVQKRSFNVTFVLISVTEEELRNAVKIKGSFILLRYVYYLVTSLRCGDDCIDELAQAVTTDTRSALLTLGTDRVTCVTIY